MLKVKKNLAEFAARFLNCVFDLSPRNKEIASFKHIEQKLLLLGGLFLSHH